MRPSGPSTSSLAALSYRLHASLAAEHSGPTRWDYRPLDTLSITADLSSPSSKPSPRKLTTPFAWLDPAVLTGTSVLGTKASTAQVHPYKFTTSMMDLAKTKGVKVVFATVVALVRPDEVGGPFVLRAVERDGGKEVEIPATKIVITAGPWTGRLLKELGLKGGRARGIDGSRAHSVVLRTATSRQLPAQALFTSIKALDTRSTHEPEIYVRCFSHCATVWVWRRLTSRRSQNRPDGTAYACGPTDKSHLPPKASDVVVDPRATAEIVDQVAALSPEFLKVGTGDHEAMIEVEQACYLPEGSGDPVIGKLEEVIYVASGHSCWGITNGTLSGSFPLGPAAELTLRLLGCRSRDGVVCCGARPGWKSLFGKYLRTQSVTFVL